MFEPSEEDEVKVLATKRSLEDTEAEQPTKKRKIGSARGVAEEEPLYETIDLD